jgi:HPt (histidine-containing phosphotransfer) domain-containing protein
MPNVGLCDQLSAPEAFDPSAMLARLNATIGFFAELVEVFLDEYPPLVQEMRSAIAEKDATRLKYAAHALAGSIGNFTDAPPYDIARQMESMAENSSWEDSQNTLQALVQAVDRFADSLKRGVQKTGIIARQPNSKRR